MGGFWYFWRAVVSSIGEGRGSDVCLDGGAGLRAAAAPEFRLWRSLATAAWFSEPVAAHHRSRPGAHGAPKPEAAGSRAAPGLLAP